MTKEANTKLLFRFDDCELDDGAFQLRRGGVPHAVEPQVLDLLLVLVRARGRLVTKDEIFEAVWKERVVSEATLSSRIRAARRAIGEGPTDGSRIRTVVGRGFRFEGPVELVEAPDEPAADAGGASSPSRVIPIVAASGARADVHHVRCSKHMCVVGEFVCYSWAFSPTYEGMLVRGSLRLSPATGSPLPASAQYVEDLPHVRLSHAGRAACVDHALYLDVEDSANASRLFITLLCPGLPGTVLLGTMCGRIFHDPSSEVAATRMLALRVHSPLAEQPAGPYVEPSAAAIAADLQALGLPLQNNDAIGEVIERFFLVDDASSKAMRITAHDNHRINVAADRLLKTPAFDEREALA